MVEEIPIHGPNEGLVKVLETLLSQAKTGEIKSIVYAVSWENSDVAGGWAIGRQGEIAALMGQIDLTKQEIILKEMIRQGDFEIGDLCN